MVRGRPKRIAVLGSGAVKEKSPTYQQALKLGSALAKAGFNICHGGYGGVMEAVAKGCHQADGYNTGITIGKALSKVNPYADVEIRMPSWQGRLLKLIEISDAYIFCDGATGTLNELFFVWEMANRKLHQKPIIVLGKRLQQIVRFFKREPSVKIPPCFYLASSISQAIKTLIGDRA